MTQDFGDLGWSEVCTDDACGWPAAHSHNFKLGKQISKSCCNREMWAVQLFESKFGQNERILRNAYTCNACANTDGVVLYHGQPKSYKSIYLDASIIGY